VSEILGFPSISHVFVSGPKWAPCLERVRSNRILANVSSLSRMFLGPRKAWRPGYIKVSKRCKVFHDDWQRFHIYKAYDTQDRYALRYSATVPFWFIIPSASGSNTVVWLFIAP
ncbi:hypothetical protein Tco_1416782, partial [Tanacetum coccineum]